MSDMGFGEKHKKIILLCLVPILCTAAIATVSRLMGFTGASVSVCLIFIAVIFSAADLLSVIWLRKSAVLFPIVSLISDTGLMMVTNFIGDTELLLPFAAVGVGSAIATSSVIGLVKRLIGKKEARVR